MLSTAVQDKGTNCVSAGGGLRDRHGLCVSTPLGQACTVQGRSAKRAAVHREDAYSSDAGDACEEVSGANSDNK